MFIFIILPLPTLSRGFHKRFIFLWSSLSAMFTDAFLVHQRLGHEKVSTTPGTLWPPIPRPNKQRRGSAGSSGFPREEETVILVWFFLGCYFFCCFGCEKAPPSSEKSRKQGCFYTLFRSIFDRFKKPEGRFLLLELGKFKLQLSKFV